MRTGSLCSGYEGLGLAVQAVLGGELAWVADNDPGASAILAHRFPSVPNLGDITAADWSAVEPVDVLTAGFPCQDVSCAGGRAGLREGNRTGVWAYVARAIDELRPSLVVLENVRGLLSAGADSDVELCPWCLGEAGTEHALRACGAVLGDLADILYDTRGAVVSAADAGAPHRRERVFIVAWPAADAEDSGWDELNDGREPRTHGAAPVGRHAGVARNDRGGRLAAADAERDGLQGGRPAAGTDTGWPGAASIGCGSAVSNTATADARGQRWDGWAHVSGDGRPAPVREQARSHSSDSSGTPAEDSYGAASGERRIAGPGETEGGRSWADASGPGGAPATADTDSSGRRPDEHDLSAGESDADRLALADAESDGRDARRPESAGVIGGLHAAECGDGVAADSESQRHGHTGPQGQRGIPAAAVSGALADAQSHGDTDEPGGDHKQPLGTESRPGDGTSGRDRAAGTREPERGPAVVAWGAYEPAIRRWERATGRPAPAPTEPGRTGQRLSPRFVEFLMGLPEGWVTDVPGLSRNAQLKALGNGVVPAQAAMALRLLLDRSGHLPLVAAALEEAV